MLRKSQVNIKFNTILLVLLSFLLYSCGSDNRKFFSLSDSFEQTELEEGSLYSKHKRVKIGAPEQLCDSLSYHGKHSVKLDENYPYGLNLRIKKVKTDEFVTMQVRYYGEGNLVLVASHKDANYFYRKKEETVTSADGWKVLQIELSVPPIMDGETLNLYVWRSNGTTILVDDLKVSYSAGKEFPEYDPLDAIHLYIDSLDLLQLERKRDQAFQTGILVTEENDFVNGILYYKDSLMPVEIRLKGDWLDHLEGRKWSFRIKVRKEFTWNRMKTFSLHTPLARNFLDEWVAHELYRQNDVLATRYGFVPLTLNGESLGLYAWEEHFDKQIIESLNRREGPILKFDETHFWNVMKKFVNTDFYHTLPVLQSADILTFKENKVMADTALRHQFLTGRDLMDQYRYFNYPISEVFDTEKLAGYIALMDLTRGFHSINWHNQRAYYNPVISKLEPIFFDGYTEEGVYDPGRPAISGHLILDTTTAKKFENIFWAAIFEDPSFMDAYYDWMERISNDAFLDAFFSRIDKQLKHYSSWVTEEFPAYRYHRDFLYENAAGIRAGWSFFEEFVNNRDAYPRLGNTEIELETYTPDYDHQVVPDFVKVYPVDTTENVLSLLVRNFFTQELTIIGVSEVSPRQEILLDPRPVLRPFPGTTHDFSELVIQVPIGTKYVWLTSEIDNQFFSVPVSEFQTPGKKTPRQELMSGKKLRLPADVVISGNQIIFRPGLTGITSPIIIPEGYLVSFLPGSKLDMTEGAFLISSSPVEMKGTADQPVRIFSSDKTANGFTVLQAKDTSYVHHVHFSGLNTLSYKGWELTGAVNFYESPVDIRFCVFEDNVCEDALNTIRTVFKVSDSQFINIFADAFDSDFCKGSVVHSSFYNVGNDAIDFSGSQVEIRDCTIEKISDKGISCGEESTLWVYNTSVSGAYIGYASKDLSRLVLEDCRLSGAVYGLLAFQKKPEYGPGWIDATGFRSSDVENLHLVERASRVRINASVVNGQEEELALRFY